MTRLNGCHNRPRPTAATSYQAQAGWEYRNVLCAEPYEAPRDEPTRIPVLVDIPHVMSTECRYDASATDQGCVACVHAMHLRAAAPDVGVASPT